MFTRALCPLLVLLVLAWITPHASAQTLKELQAALVEANDAKKPAEMRTLVDQILNHPDAGDGDRVAARMMLIRATRFENAGLDKIIEAANAVIESKGATPSHAMSACLEVGQYANNSGALDKGLEWLSRCRDIIIANKLWGAAPVVFRDLATSKRALGDRLGAAETMLEGLATLDERKMALAYYYQPPWLDHLACFGPDNADKELRGQTLALNLVARTKKLEDISKTFDLLVRLSAYARPAATAETKRAFLAALDSLASAARAAEKTEDLDPAAVADKISSWRASLPAPE
ncbi:MAG: hypothetical protein V2A58_10090 [Planctomycetota bacterium]